MSIMLRCQTYHHTFLPSTFQLFALLLPNSRRLSAFLGEPVKGEIRRKFSFEIRERGKVCFRKRQLPRRLFVGGAHSTARHLPSRRSPLSFLLSTHLYLKMDRLESWGEQLSNLTVYDIKNYYNSVRERRADGRSL